MASDGYPRTYENQGESRWRAIFLCEGATTWIEKWHGEDDWRVVENREWREGEMNAAGFERIE